MFRCIDRTSASFGMFGNCFTQRTLFQTTAVIFILRGVFDPSKVWYRALFSDAKVKPCSNFLCSQNTLVNYVPLNMESMYMRVEIWQRIRVLSWIRVCSRCEFNTDISRYLIYLIHPVCLLVVLVVVVVVVYVSPGISVIITILALFLISTCL